MMGTVDRDLRAMMDAVFAEYRQSHGPTADFDADLWSRMDGLGLVRLTAPESAGGSGASWFDASELVTAAVRNGIRLPLAEHDLLACAVLNDAGLSSNDGLVRTIAFTDAKGEVTGVPWASAVDRVVVVGSPSDSGAFVADIATDDLEIVDGTNLIGEPRATLREVPDGVSRTAVPASLAELASLKYALVRGIQVCAALERAVELALEHSTTRIQFGKPLAKLQAVQSLIADAAAETALARTATETALMAAVASGWSEYRLPFLVAVARSCAGHAATVVVRNVHQVHGAIGTTDEHRLHEYTRAALAWRGEAGSVRHWDQQVGGYANQAGPEGLWPLITG